MKTRLLLSLLAVCFSITAFAQQIGNGITPEISNYNQALSSGMYFKGTYFYPYPSETPSLIGSDFIISAKNTSANMQLRVSRSAYYQVGSLNEGIYFRISHSGTTQSSDWIKLAATSDINTFTKNQIIKAKLGINTISPSYDLDVVGTGRFTGNVFMNGKVGIKVSNPTYDLDVNGVIRAKEVRVETGWADFVFDKSYELPALSEVKAHIEEHKHLPGMPTAAEVKENGIGLSEATTLLLQKVEELTLYVIQQNEEIKMLKEQIKK